MPKRVQKLLEQEIPEDLGIPGKMYFDKPKVIEMASFRKSEIPDSDPVTNSKLGPEEFYQRETKIRLGSSHRQGHQYKTLPESLVYSLPLRPTQEQAHEYIRLKAIEGYGEGAIVARRWCEEWKIRWHGQWGRIQRVISFVPMMSNTPWHPFYIEWFDRQVADEGAWAEDLVIIHCALDKSLLEDLLEAQGIERKDK